MVGFSCCRWPTAAINVRLLGWYWRLLRRLPSKLPHSSRSAFIVRAAVRQREPSHTVWWPSSDAAPRAAADVARWWSLSARRSARWIRWRWRWRRRTEQLLQHPWRVSEQLLQPLRPERSAATSRWPARQSRARPWAAWTAGAAAWWRLAAWTARTAWPAAWWWWRFSWRRFSWRTRRTWRRTRTTEAVDPSACLDAVSARHAGPRLLQGVAVGPVWVAAPHGHVPRRAWHCRRHVAGRQSRPHGQVNTS